MKDFDFNDAYSIVSEKLIGWLKGFIDMLPNILVAILIFVAFYFVAKLVRKLFGKLMSKISNNKSLIKLSGNTLAFIVNVIGLFIALGVLNLDKTVTSLLAGVGVIGLALGFAFQDTAANFMAGIFLTIQKPFKLGEIIQSNDFMGTVKHIDLRTTTIHTFQGQEVILPNKDVFQNAITNFSNTGRRRVDLSCGVSYGDDLKKVRDIAIKAIEGSDFLAKDEKVDLVFKEFGDSSINFDIRFWLNDTAQSVYKHSTSEAIIQLKQAFDDNDIMIPFPIRTLDFGIRGGEKLNPKMLSLNNSES